MLNLLVQIYESKFIVKVQGVDAVFLVAVRKCNKMLQIVIIDLLLFMLLLLC